MSTYRVIDRPWEPKELRYMVQELRGDEWVNLRALPDTELAAAYIRDRMGSPAVVFQVEAKY